jgi:hypothetical protein
MAMRGRPVAIAVLVAAILSAGCDVSGNLLGGREECWGSEPRAASLWRGIFAMDDFGVRLDTAEGEVIALLPGALQMRVGEDLTGEIVDGDRVVAREGDDITLFGGMGGDGALVVCAVEEIHATGAAP